MREKSKVWSNRSVAILAYGILTSSLTAQTYDHGPSLSFLEDNDIFVGKDRHYTQGAKISYLHGDGFLPGIIGSCDETLPEWWFEKKASQFGYQIGQSIYTPANLKTTAPQPNDRPFAGWLYVGLILQRRGVTSSEHPLQESFEIQAGVIGEAAGAEFAQRVTHKNEPLGWQNQLKNEPGINLRYQRSVRYSVNLFKGLKSEFIPYGGASLGSVDTSIRAGGQLRLGTNLPDDFGVQTARSLASPSGGRSRSEPETPVGFYFFGGAEGRAVLHDTSLDGNLFHNSASIAKEYFTGELRVGVVLQLAHWEFGYTHVFLSPEFRGQTTTDTFGSAFVKLRF